MICATCKTRECALGCTKCDPCIDEENRLWQEVLATQRERIAAVKASRLAIVKEAIALERFRKISKTESSCAA